MGLSLRICYFPMTLKTATFFLIFLSLFISDALAQNVIRGPYLQAVCQDKISIRWRTSSATNSKVWYGASPVNLTQSKSLSLSTVDHEVLLTSLLPNTVYYYAIGNSNGTLAGATSNHYFKTSPLPNTATPISMWVLGDAGKRNTAQRSVRDAFYTYNAGAPVDLILTLGDNAYSDGTDSEFQDAWFENMYEDRLINIPLFQTYGNHDGESADGADGTGPYFDIFTMPTDGSCGGVASGNESYYSFDYGDVHIISLNTWDVPRTATSQMIQWLATDLAANNRKWTIVKFHHPVYDGRYDIESDTKLLNTEMRESCVPLFDQYDVDLVLMGHSHTYQRSYLIDGHVDKSPTFNPATMGINMGDGQLDGDGAYQKVNGKGIVYVVSGTAGSVSSVDNLNHPVMYHNALTLGSLMIQIEDDQLDAKFLTAGGIIDDYFTITKEVNIADADGDGTPDINDFCPGGPEPGAICNDNNSATHNDVITANCICQGVPYDCPVLMTNVGTSCNDNNPATYEDIVNGSCICAGIPFDCPLYLSNIGSPCNDNNPNTYEDKLNENCTCTGLPVANVVTSTIKLLSNSDDAEQASNGAVNLNSTDLEMVQDNSKQTIGLRYALANIPPGAYILDAYLQFAVDEVGSATTTLQIKGELATNAPTFSNSNGNITGRTRTISSVNWTVDTWLTVGLETTAQRSPTLSPIIQEIMSQSNYTAATPIVFIIDGEGKRVAISNDKNNSDGPVLVVTYGLYCPDSDGDGICDQDDPCPASIGYIGGPCDDGNPATYNDLVNANCECQGQMVVIYDCPSLQLNIGASCNDNNTATINDVVNANCECQGQMVVTYDCPSLQLNIGASCNDNNTATINDVVNANCECQGEFVSTYDCPQLSLNVGDVCDDGDATTLNDQVQADCSCAGAIPMGFACARVIASNGDAEEKSNGTMSLNSSDLELVKESSLQTIGMRFLNTDIPAGAIISSADIQFTVDETKNVNPCHLIIYGELHPNPVAFTTSNGNISNRTKTSTYLSWMPEVWPVINASGPEQQSVDIAPILQEIVNQPGYTSGNAIVIIIEGSGTRIAESYDGDPQKAPELCVEYDVTTTNTAAMVSNTVANNTAANTVKSNNIATTEDEQVIAEAIATQGPSDLEKLKVYPNPAKDYLILRFDPHQINRVARIQIWDSNGRLVHNEKQSITAGQVEVRIKGFALPNGNYTVQLHRDPYLKSAKFVVYK
jgi:predicted phosphodiesterase